MSNRYDDIIDLPHHQSKRHPQMSLQDRAAQFAPFAALTGFTAAIQETGKIVEKKKELSEDKKQLLNEQLLYIQSILTTFPVVRITYFLLDEKKNGGSYVTSEEIIRKIDDYQRAILTQSRKVILLDDIIMIEIVKEDGL